MSISSSNPTFDRSGLVASIACAVHCAATPFVVIFLPFGGLALTGESALETLFAIGSVLIGATSAKIGSSFHNSHKPLLMALLGGAMIAAGRLTLSAAVWQETLLVVSGACLIAGAHALNLYLCRCRACHGEEPILAIDTPIVRS